MHLQIIYFGVIFFPFPTHVPTNTIVMQRDCSYDFWSLTLHCIQQPSEVFKENKHVIFTGNGYSAEWPVEANKRGLPNLNTTPKAIATWNSEKNKTLGQIATFDVTTFCTIGYFGQPFHSVTSHQVSSEVVLNSRLQDQICTSLHIFVVFHLSRHLQASLDTTVDILWLVESMLADFDMLRKETVGDPEDLHSRGDWGTSGSDVWKLYLFNVLWSLPWLHGSFCLCLTLVSVVVFVACWLWFPIVDSFEGVVGVLRVKRVLFGWSAGGKMMKLGACCHWNRFKKHHQIYPQQYSELYLIAVFK